jgi:hypothetical protein
MVSNGSCLSTDTAYGSAMMTVLPNGTPLVGVSVSPDDTVCQFTLTTFTAVPAFGGPSPIINWKVNGTSVGSGPLYAYNPVQGDVVECAMASSYLCRLADSAYSSALSMTVDTIETPHIAVVSHAPAVIIQGDSVAFSTIVTNVGANPAYQWRVNGHPVPGATQSVYAGVFHDNDSIVCAVTSSGVCGDITTFDWAILTVHPLNVQQYGDPGNITLLPNPNNGTFTLKGRLLSGKPDEMVIKITDVLGQIVYENSFTSTSGEFNKQIILDHTLPAATYLLHLYSANEEMVFHFVINR